MLRSSMEGNPTGGTHPQTDLPIQNRGNRLAVQATGILLCGKFTGKLGFLVQPSENKYTEIGSPFF